MKKVIIRKDSYYDSVFLMEITAKLKRLEGVREAVVAMATAQNRQLIGGLGFGGDALGGAAPGDLVIALEADGEPDFAELEKKLDDLLRSSRRETAEGAFRPSDIKGALQQLSGANLAIISVGGSYAWYEAKRALEAGLHVMLFSDNVPVEREVELKKMATGMGLLVMGPDCGTAIINGMPLCFANDVRRGGVGIVGASGTGIQQVSVLIDRLGEGISQAIGTGGRDLSKQVGGLTMMQGIEALKNDAATKVILVISKPPDRDVGGRIVDTLASTGKPAVVHFIGTGTSAPGAGVSFASSLEEAALMACSALTGRPQDGGMFSVDTSEMRALIERQRKTKSKDQRHIRGYFTGGTLCDEALFILSREIEPVYSNIHPERSLRLEDPRRSKGHSLIDLGDDAFTSGRPHPMIDPSARVERIEQEMGDPSVSVMLLDVMLGYASHPDPAGALLPVLEAVKRKAKERGGDVTLLATVVGTDRDVQGLAAQRAKLEGIGVIVTESNAQMARLALRIAGGKP